MKDFRTPLLLICLSSVALSTLVEKHGTGIKAQKTTGFVSTDINYPDNSKELKDITKSLQKSYSRILKQTRNRGPEPRDLALSARSEKKKVALPVVINVEPQNDANNGGPVDSKIPGITSPVISPIGTAIQPLVANGTGEEVKGEANGNEGSQLLNEVKDVEEQGLKDSLAGSNDIEEGETIKDNRTDEDEQLADHTLENEGQSVDAINEDQDQHIDETKKDANQPVVEDIEKSDQAVDEKHTDIAEPDIDEVHETDPKQTDIKEVDKNTPIDEEIHEEDTEKLPDTTDITDPPKNDITIEDHETKDPLTTETPIDNIEEKDEALQAEPHDDLQDQLVPLTTGDQPNDQQLLTDHLPNQITEPELTDALPKDTSGQTEEQVALETQTEPGIKDTKDVGAVKTDDFDPMVNGFSPTSFDEDVKAVLSSNNDEIDIKDMEGDENTTQGTIEKPGLDDDKNAIKETKESQPGDHDNVNMTGDEKLLSPPKIDTYELKVPSDTQPEEKADLETPKSEALVEKKDEIDENRDKLTEPLVGEQDEKKETTEVPKIDQVDENIKTEEIQPGLPEDKKTVDTGIESLIHKDDETTPEQVLDNNEGVEPSEDSTLLKMLEADDTETDEDQTQSNAQAKTIDSQPIDFEPMKRLFKPVKQDPISRTEPSTNTDGLKVPELPTEPSTPLPPLGDTPALGGSNPGIVIDAPSPSKSTPVYKSNYTGQDPNASANDVSGGAINTSSTAEASVKQVGTAESVVGCDLLNNKKSVVIIQISVVLLVALFK